MEKVKVSKEVAAALEIAKFWLGSKYYKKWILDSYHKGSLMHKEFDDLEKVLWKYEIYELAEILFNGYEIEETPEDKVIEYVNKYVPKSCFAHFAIKEILNILEIKIKGINS